jgi:D-sedoheptulose 7-phosphate isomerase
MITNLNFSKLLSRYPILVECEESIIQATNLLIGCFETKGKLLTFGNGGSACDSEHLCGELQKGFLSKRRVNTPKSNLHSEFIENLQEGLPAISLVTHFATHTAFNNDVNPDYCFAQGVYALSQPKDVTWGFSTSGNSVNVVKALKLSKELGLKSIALTGEKESDCSKYASVTIFAPSSKVHFIQELHLPIYHAICLELENYFWPENK